MDIRWLEAASVLASLLRFSWRSTYECCESRPQLFRPPRKRCNTLSHLLYLCRYAARVFSRLSAFCALFYVTIVRQLQLNPHARTCSARRACLMVLPVRLTSYSAFREGQVVFSVK